MSLVRNEQIKLQAAYWNGLAIGGFIVGGLAFTLSAIDRLDPDQSMSWIVFPQYFIAFIVSYAMHRFARGILRNLEE